MVVMAISDALDVSHEFIGSLAALLNLPMQIELSGTLRDRRLVSTSAS